MVVEVASKLGQSVSQSLGGVGLAGGSLLLRLRRTSIALLALVGAVGFGLIVFISQLGWPAGLSGPLPSAPGKTTVAPGVALTQPASVAAGVPAANGAAAAPGRHRVRHGKNVGAKRAAGQSKLGGSQGVGTANGSQPGTGGGEPVSKQAPGATAQPAPVTASPAAPTSTSAASGNGSSSAAGNAKAASDGARSTNIASAKSGGPKTAGNESSSAGSKAGESAGAKAQHDESVAATSPPPVATPAPAPAPANPAAAKEAADSGR